MKKRETELNKKVQSAHFNSIAQLLEKTPATGGIPEISERQIQAILGNENGNVPAAEGAEANNDVEGRREQKTTGDNNADKPVKTETVQRPEVGNDQKKLELWLDNVKRRPSVKVDKKQLVHFDCDLIETFKLFSEVVRVPMNKIISAIVEDWLAEHGNNLKQLQKKILLKILDKT
ncbi:MAG: hypothetical protein LBP63_08195 [Prevotellaceae bacterium]|jgi:hypothetical protein|nr:hypothetical protein [Prevotellaceae bacterium]